MTRDRTTVDRGGTFTDVIRVIDGVARVEKVPSDVAVIGELAEGALTFGTTVATNALLERAGVPTLLVVTRGFADLPWIGDMARPGLFDPEATWPEPLCSRVVEVGGRIDAEGVELEALQIPDELDLDGIEAVAIVLLNSHRNPDHERRVASALRQRHPDLFVTLGHQVSPELGYLSRIETTLVDAAITPVLQAALERDRIPDDAGAMRSDGSLSPVQAFRAPDAVLSGPAGGVLAVAEIARAAGFRRAVGLDMGGTSTDVCRVGETGLPRVEGDVRVAGVRLRRPMIEVVTIAAGGGSVCWNDGLRIGVGPRSAGAHPGPQCYGRGGPPTLTDAALACGLVEASAFDPPLREDLVDLPGDPEDFLDVARDAMAEAVRRLATSRGIDLSDHALVAYGGAAGQHAAEVADRLDIDTVLVHPLAGGLSAFGQLLARREETATQAVWAPLHEVDLQAGWAALEDDLPALGSVVRTAALRHQGTDHALEVEGEDAEALRTAFEEEHHRRYGFDRDAPIEVVNLRVRVRETAPDLPSVDADPWDLDGSVVEGPALLTNPTTAVHVPGGWSARLDGDLLRLDRLEVRERPAATTRTELGVALWGNRFMAIAEQAGAVLQRLARSVNIRERLDFSCAVFDQGGHLIANAPHIPVHLGAMGETVRDLIRTVDVLEDGDSFLTNHPLAGGSHLPDLTVVTCVVHQGQRFFVASRGHHADVGGSTPGSMPPYSTSLDEEGFVVRHLPLLQEGTLSPALAEVIAASRQPELVMADLEAQLAANQHAGTLLREAGDAETLVAWMGHLQDVAEEAMGTVIADLPEEAHAEDVLDDMLLRVRLRREGATLEVDFTGTGGPDPRNLNAPPAVVRAAVLYALRVLVDAPIPLNEGALRHVRIVTPEPSLLAPPPGAAVSGGNVETSQRIVDLVLRATGRMAASQGTMNNLTLGGPGWTFYETIGGGQGASDRADGASGRQLHMTNTRATDPEVLEQRLPLRLCRLSLRNSSGGDGHHRGGDGLIRELELVEGGTAAMLATRRDHGAPGLGGGRDGLPGRDQVCRSGRWEAWDGEPVQLDPRDRVRVETPGGGGHGAPSTD